jgi:hypothetical protein
MLTDKMLCWDDKCFVITFDNFTSVKLCFMNCSNEMLLNVAWT